MNRGFTVWFTGLSGSGKTTILHRLGKKLKELCRNVEVFDGDVIRTDHCIDLGLSKQEHDIFMHRTAFVCKLLTANGMAVISAAISPYREARDKARKEIGDFVEVYVKCPLEVCIERDVKGLYRMALQGEIQTFPGISSPYEEPLNPEIIVETHKETVEESTNKIIKKLVVLGYIPDITSEEDLYSDKEEAVIAKRLSGLGYID
ncbi:MAG: adenylyl-sulfate kinase [wastewater metagenome]|nr:adenylyl-sulfate kinase [Candidatus Loosdrechtia aerotolerans]